jgi:hypothetical protein
MVNHQKKKGSEIFLLFYVSPVLPGQGGMNHPYTCFPIFSLSR